MKKNLLLLILLAVVMASCTENKETKKLFLRPPSITLSAQDTTEINQKIQTHISLLKENKLNELADILYYLQEDNTINSLNEEQKASFVKGMSLFKIYDVKIKHLIIRSEYNNELCATLKIKEDGDFEKNYGVTKFYFNPVKIDGVWYITIRDKKSKGVERAY